MAPPSSLKRKPEFSEAQYENSPSIMSEGGDAMLSPTKKRKLRLKPLPTPAQAKHEPQNGMPENELSDALAKLSFDKDDQKTNTDADTDTENDESTVSTAQTTPETFAGPRQPALALAIYLNTKFQPFILVKPSFAAGGFARCSIWLGLHDRKLYVRKLQGSFEGTPKDITRYVEHSGVPKLVANMSHGMNPFKLEPVKLKFGALDAAVDSHLKSLSRLSYWTTMTEYINGPTLLAVFEGFAGKGYVFPEPAIWQCGKVLLDIIRKMRFPNPSAGDKYVQPMSHNDIYPRNVLLANDDDVEQATTTSFHLIDFGIATLQSDPHHRIRDLSHVIDLLCGMMLNQNLGPSAKARVKRAKEEHGWPYSHELTLKMAEMEEVNSNSIPYGFPPKFWFDKWVKNFESMASRSSAKFKKAGKSMKIPLQKPLTIERPWLFRGDNAVEEMKHFIAKQTGCSPYQQVWLEEETLKIVGVDEEMYWNKPEVELPLRHGASFRKKQKTPVAPW